MKSPFRHRWLRLVLLGAAWVAWSAVLAGFVAGGRLEAPSTSLSVAIVLPLLVIVVWTVVEICLGFWSLMGPWALTLLVPILGVVAWNAAGRPQPPVNPPSPAFSASATASPAGSFAPPPLVTPTPLPTLACAQPGTAQTAADGQIITKAAAGGVSLLLPRSCAGFSLFYQQGLDQTAATDYLDGLMLGYPRYVADSGVTPKERIGVFVLANAAQRAAACKAVLSVCSIAADDAAPGIQTQGQIWLDDSKYKSQTYRRSAAAHELAHAFVLAASGLGYRNVPDWLNEGFAVYNEIAVPAERQPLAAERVAAQDRKIVLDALSGKGPLPPFAWSDISTIKQWDANYPDQQKQDLQYAQSYYAVKWLVDKKGGPQAMWKLFSTFDGMPFSEALSKADGLSQADFEAQLKAAWTAELARPADAAHIAVKLSATGIQGNTAVFLVRRHPDGSEDRAYTRPLKAGSYSFGLSADGALSSTDDPALPMTTDHGGNVTCDDCLIVTISSANYRGVNGAAARGAETLSYDLAYGKWAPGSRYFYAEAADHGDLLPGAMSDPFPDGNQIQVSFVGQA